MVSQDEKLRPTASKIVNHQYLRSNSMSKSRSQLYKELKETKAKLRLLEMEIASKNERPSWMNKFSVARAPVVNKNASSSPQTSPIARQKSPVSKVTCSNRLLVGRGTPKSNSCLL
jgi:hypothetical protein